MRFLVAAFALAACASTGPVAPAPVVSAAPVIAAERAFAADAAERGWVAAFRAYAAADATQLSPNPVNAQENLARIEGNGGTNLDWRPAFAGIARSADLGFTTGPFLFRGRAGIVGHYFTVWRLQADGSWKWIFDAGVDVADPGPAVAPDAEVPRLAVSERGLGSAQAALEAVGGIERFIYRARPDPRQQLIARFSADVHLNRANQGPAVGRDAATALARATALNASDEPLRMEASAAGDMVFVLGRAEAGYYARIWQLQGADWRIVFDEIVPAEG